MELEDRIKQLERRQRSEKYLKKWYQKCDETDV